MTTGTEAPPAPQPPGPYTRTPPKLDHPYDAPPPHPAHPNPPATPPNPSAKPKAPDHSRPHPPRPSREATPPGRTPATPGDAARGPARRVAQRAPSTQRQPKGQGHRDDHDDPGHLSSRRPNLNVPSSGQRTPAREASPPSTRSGRKARQRLPHRATTRRLS